MTHQVALHGLEVGLEAEGAGHDAGDGGQPPGPHGPQPAAQHHALPGVHQDRGRRRYGELRVVGTLTSAAAARRRRGIPGALAAVVAADAVRGLGGGCGEWVRAQLCEVVGADGGGHPVEGAREELGGEGDAEVAPRDAGEGGNGRVAGVCWRDRCAQGDEDVQEEERVAGQVGGEDLGSGAGGAERKAVREHPELVGEREEHDGLPAADCGGPRVEGLGNNTPRAVDLWQVEVHFAKAFCFQLFISALGLFSWCHKDGPSLPLCLRNARTSPRLLRRFSVEPFLPIQCGKNPQDFFLDFNSTIKKPTP